MVLAIKVYNPVNNVANTHGSYDTQLPTNQENNICISQVKNNVDFRGKGVKSQIKSTMEAYLKEIF